MAYNLYAVVGRQEIIQRHAMGVSAARVVPLRQGFALVPNTRALAAELETVGLPPPRTAPPDEGFVALTAQVAAWAETASEDGAVAYVEVDCFGGDCERAAIVWTRAEVALGPFAYAEDEAAEERRARFELLQRDPDAFVAATLARLPGLTTNRVLRELGVVAGESSDEFAALGLGRHRRTAEWGAADREGDDDVR